MCVYEVSAIHRLVSLLGWKIIIIVVVVVGTNTNKTF